MSTVEVIQQLEHLDNAQRLAIIEVASRLIRQDLVSARRSDERLRQKALDVRDLYAPGGELTEWTALDCEEVADGSLPR
jgi:hypothetical protein